MHQLLERLLAVDAKHDKDKLIVGYNPSINGYNML